MKKCRKRIHPRRRICILLVLIAAAIGALLLCGSSAGKNSAYMIAENGVIYSTFDFQGLFLYEETVVTADAAGTFTTGFCEGDKIAAGEAAGELKLLNDIGTDPVAIVASPVAGIFTPTVDGWETVLNADNIENLDLGEVFNAYTAPEKQVSAFVRQGEPCFKVMDNTHDVYLLAALNSVCLTADTVTVRLCGEEATADVVFTKQYYGEYYTLLALSPLDAYFENRATEGELVLNELEGIVISASAVTKRFGETGVYLVERGNLSFCPVTVLGEENANVLVEGVEAGDCILCDVN